MNQSSNLFILIPASFVALWVIVCLLLSRMSGWRLLAERFSSEWKDLSSSYRFVSGSMNHGASRKLMAVNFNNCLVIAFGPEGLMVRMPLPFRMGHHPLLIPWSAFESIAKQKVWWWDALVLVVREPKITICILGKPGQAMEKFISERNLVPKAV